MKNSATNITIIGGGASGLAVAALLSRAGVKNTVIEKNVRVGKKLLTTGNGRCNLGNVSNRISEKERTFTAYNNPDFVKKILQNWQGAEHFFKEFGLVTCADTEGRLYPYSNTANSVLDTLRRACVHTDFRCETECSKKEFHRLFNTGIVIWATGNAPLVFLQELGHTIIEPLPSLCPVMTYERLTRPLKGLRIRADASAIAGEEILKSEYGEVQFGDGFLSGICIMNISRKLAQLFRDYAKSQSPLNLTISLDIAPEFNEDEIKQIGYEGLFHSRIVQVLNKNQIPPKDWRFPVTGKAPWQKSQVMSGGVDVSELNDDLSSKICSTLYIIGESLDIDGDCGGYNLEWAWACAKRVADSILRQF
ncbi:MAG: NAD(P)/FAD-dependent oxidoreductase [Oscillospiraceae bacterium]|nr:NAD(P)/FAD-dependent oxidoreductase [Oscillospiraceae bacterium]